MGWCLQDWNAVAGVLLNLLVPAGDGVRRRVAPGVVIESEEIGADGIIAAVHVRGHLVAVALHISSRVTNRDGSVAASTDVRPHITSDSLDVRSSECVGIIVDDLVGRVEEQRVVVLGEGVNGREDGLEVDVVVGHGDGLVVQAVERVEGGVDIQSEVYPSVGELLHAVVVVLGVVDRVDADSVDAELDELGNVALATLGVGDGVLVGGGAAGLVIDTADVEAVAVGVVEGCVRVSTGDLEKSLGVLTIAFDAHRRGLGVGDGVLPLLNHWASKGGGEDASGGENGSLHGDNHACYDVCSTQFSAAKTSVSPWLQRGSKEERRKKRVGIVDLKES